MVRINVLANRKTAGAKAPRKTEALKTGIAKRRIGRKSTYHPRPTPAWQKGIESFFPRKSSMGPSAKKQNKNDDSGLTDKPCTSGSSDMDCIPGPSGIASGLTDKPCTSGSSDMDCIPGPSGIASESNKRNGASTSSSTSAKYEENNPGHSEDKEDTEVDEEDTEVDEEDSEVDEEDTEVDEDKENKENEEESE